jgi:AcrR family transcriptional regulator
MARWEPHARERLERAALALFVERGYDATTVSDIAERAGLTKSTFFRQFADKREVLSSGQDILIDVFRNAIANAPPSANAIDWLSAALESAEPLFTPERHKLALQRRAVVAANSELQERELLKRARMSSAIADALRDRGVDEMAARLAAEMGVLAFSTAFARWANPGNRTPYTTIVRTTLAEFQTRAKMLSETEPSVARPPRPAT